MPDSEPWTIGRLLTWTTDYLKQHGSDSPRLDAEVLLAAACQCERIDLYTTFHEAPPDATRDQFRDWVRRRSAGAPVAYLVGHKEFYSLSFFVTPAVLIPRPETELLVATVLDLIKQTPAQETIRIADVGTGSGIIATCLAKYAPGCHVIAIDTSLPALEVAKNNVREHQVDDRVELIESDLFNDVPAQQFDFIVSNPPYVSEQEFADLPIDVRDHEPPTALIAGDTGTEIIARLIPQAAERLRPGGWLALEISPMIAEQVKQMLADDGRFQQATTSKDLANFARVVTAKRIVN